MHEMGLALEVVDAVTERAGSARVKRVVVHVGALAAVLPDALRFSFEVACEGTAAEGATLEIVEIPAEARCRSCSAVAILRAAFGCCPCGSTDLDFLSGEDLRIFEMELHDPPRSAPADLAPRPDGKDVP